MIRSIIDPIVHVHTCNRCVAAWLAVCAGPKLVRYDEEAHELVVVAMQYTDPVIHTAHGHQPSIRPSPEPHAFDHIQRIARIKTEAVCEEASLD